METPTETPRTRTTSVAISQEVNKLLDAITAAIRPTPTKGSVLEMLIEQEAERRGITSDPDPA